MRIDAESLVADAFRFENAQADGRKNHIALGRSGGVSGFYELAGAGHVVDARAVVLEVTSALWQLRAGHVGTRGRLDGVQLALSVPPGGAATTLHLEATTASLDGVEYAAGDLQVAGAATLEGLAMERTADGTLAIIATALAVRDVRVTRGSTTLTIAEARVERLTVASGSEPVRVSAGRVQLLGARLASGGAPVDLGRVEARDLSLRGGHLEIADLSVSGAKVAHAFPPRKSEAGPAAPGGSRRAMPDIPALDQLEGQVSLDVKVTAAVSILENKEVHHPLRVPIEAGSISFDELEHGLSALEDAILDFEVEKDELILELDVIPIVHFDNVTLVSWSLADAVDRELAGQGRVRVRRLLQYRLPAPRPARKDAVHAKKKSIRLLRVDFAPVAVSLSLPKAAEVALAGGTVRLGDAAQPSVESLTVKGALHAVLEGEACPGHLDVVAAGIHAALEGLSLGPVRLRHAKVEVAAVEGAVDFSDLSLRSVSATLREARIGDLALDVAASRG